MIDPWEEFAKAVKKAADIRAVGAYDKERDDFVLTVYQRDLEFSRTRYSKSLIERLAEESLQDEANEMGRQALSMVAERFEDYLCEEPERILVDQHFYKQLMGIVPMDPKDFITIKENNE